MGRALVRSILFRQNGTQKPTGDEKHDGRSALKAGESAELPLTTLQAKADIRSVSLKDGEGSNSPRFRSSFKSFTPSVFQSLTAVGAEKQATIP